MGRMNYRKALRKTLAEIELAGYSAAHWAEFAGINRSTLHRIVKGNAIPGIVTFLRLQKAADKLLGTSGKEKRCADATKEAA